MQISSIYLHSNKHVHLFWKSYFLSFYVLIGSRNLARESIGEFKFAEQTDSWYRNKFLLGMSLWYIKPCMAESVCPEEYKLLHRNNHIYKTSTEAHNCICLTLQRKAVWGNQQSRNNWLLVGLMAHQKSSRNSYSHFTLL